MGLFKVKSDVRDHGGGKQVARVNGDAPGVLDAALMAAAATLEPDVPSTPSSTRPAASTLTTLPQILSSLSLIESEESAVSSALSDLLAKQDPILDALRRLQVLAPALDDL